MHRASRYRLYPNQTQERQFVQLCGAGRFVYNELLAEQKREYARFEAGEREKPGCSEFDFAKRYARLKAKEGNAWLRELSAVVVRGTGAFPLGAAFAHFSRRIRESKKGKQAGFPRFKAKGRSRESFTIPEAVKIQAKRLWVAEGRLDTDEPQGAVAHAGGRPLGRRRGEGRGGVPGTGQVVRIGAVGGGSSGVALARRSLRDRPQLGEFCGGLDRGAEAHRDPV